MTCKNCQELHNGSIIKVNNNNECVFCGIKIGGNTTKPMAEKITPELIINTMAEWVENKKSIPPSLYLESALKLNILRGDIDDKIYTLEHNLNVEKAKILEIPEMTSAKAETIVKAKPEYMELRKLTARGKQIEEHIKIAKKMATLKDLEFNQ